MKALLSKHNDTKSPVSSYYGGKYSLRKPIVDLIPNHEIYVEPFFGGGSVFFHKPVSKLEVINDKSSFVINFWEVYFNDNNRAKLLGRLEGFVYSEGIFKQAKDIYHEQNNYDEIELAWAFFVLVNVSFLGTITGGFAYSKKLCHNYHDKVAYKIELMKNHQERNNLILFNRDALEVINIYRDNENCFYYLDPPYFNSDMGHYKGYKESDYKLLLEALAKVKGKFILSSYPSNILSDYVKRFGWNYTEINRTLPSNRKRKTEMVIYNFEKQEGSLF